MIRTDKFFRPDPSAQWRIGLMGTHDREGKETILAPHEEEAMPEETVIQSFPGEAFEFPDLDRSGEGCHWLPSEPPLRQHAAGTSRRDCQKFPPFHVVLMFPSAVLGGFGD